MIVGCYNMHLYCRNEQLPLFYEGDLRPCPSGYHNSGEFPHQFTGDTAAACRKRARAKGWVFAKGDATCPRCAATPPQKGPTE